MAFSFVNNGEYKLINGHKNEKGHYHLHKRSPNNYDPTLYSELWRFIVHNREQLKELQKILASKGDYQKRHSGYYTSDYINSISITSSKEHILTCQNNKTGESFNIFGYICDITYNLTIQHYKYYMGFSTNIAISDNANLDNRADKQLAFTVSDVLKYYYYTNKDIKDYGFIDFDKKDIKQFWDICKKSTTHVPNPNSIPFGLHCSKWAWRAPKYSVGILNIKNNVIDWGLENFMNQMLFISFDAFKYPEFAHNLLSLYVYGDNRTMTNNKIIKFDEPKLLVKVIEEL